MLPTYNVTKSYDISMCFALLINEKPISQTPSLFASIHCTSNLSRYLAPAL